MGPGNYASGWVQDFGVASDAPPVAADGIHFGQQGNLTFGITYYQPGSGGPRSILAIVDGQCHPLDLAYGTPEHGAFETTLSLQPGCHRYYFYVEDGQGHQHVYPSQGSLGASVGAASNCPLYGANRPADTCSPSGQTCQTGDTRQCYEGPWGTQGVGICEAGVERCIGGQWTGDCRLETLPADADTCANGLDDDCDGTVDDGCDAPQSDAGVGDAGRDADAARPGSHNVSNGGCNTAGPPSHGPPRALLGWLAALAGLGWARPILQRHFRRERHRRDQWAEAKAQTTRRCG